MGHSRNRSDIRDSGLWAPLATLLLGLLACALFVAALPAGPTPSPSLEASKRPLAQLVEERGDLAREWRATLDQLCGDPRLQAEGIAPSCQTGTISFGDELFDEDERGQLSEEGIRKLHVAIDALMRELRNNPLVWQNLESIELRGHADPRARRDPYVTNMRASQTRPMSMMLYLISDWALSERDRRDIQNLLVLSSASHSRPPPSCPEESRECYPYWRRVEIMPRLAEVPLIARLEAMESGIREALAAPSPRSAR